jgi:HD-GYP domain-containing protein (c-di-GMP phosphodiesterase class II)
MSQDLDLILNSFLDLVECDGGSIYTVEKNLKGEDVLQFKAMITRSLNISRVPEKLKKQIFRLDDKSLVGKTGLERKVFKENYSKTESENHDSSTDFIISYRTRNILSAPLITPRGELVGVIQLVNKLSEDLTFEIEFSKKDERLCAIVSAQAALAIENNKLLIEQEKILDGFVNACVTAIESRDPVTAGHSQRVCDLSLNLASAVNQNESGTYSKTNFTEVQMRELKYAAMLHDMGKIAVKEDVLQKEKKLYPWELELIETRIKLMKEAFKNELPGEKNRLELAQKFKDLDQAHKIILTANEPSVLPQEVSMGVLELTKLQVKIDNGEICCALHAHEKEKLCIPKGTLSVVERIEIEKHVSFTYEILKMVPWSKGLENVPVIAHRHHEKLDGTGYPQRVGHVDIPIQSRMLTICDIYDALTAKDRPYKAAVPIEKALFILESDVKQGKLDPELFKIFLESKAYQVVSKNPQKTKKVA